MRTVALSILLAAGVALALPASAQTPTPPSSPPDPSFPSSLIGAQSQSDPGWDGDAWRYPMGPQRYPDNPMLIGVVALKSDELTLAEKMFARVLQRKPSNADANFYLGVVRMELGQWEDARKHLEIAVQKKPKHPDPKSRLGVTYAKLGDAAGASAQRAELVKMADACKGACKRELSPYITGGIEMIDEALAEAPQG